MKRWTRNEPLQVLIAGGGVGAIECMLALRELAGSRVELALLTPEREFLYRPVTVAEAFERGEAHVYPLDEILAYIGGGQLIRDSLDHIEAAEHIAVTATGRSIPYDVLVVAVGAIPRHALPGALTFRGRRDVPALRGVLDDLVAGTARSVAFTLPSEHTWPLPLYELALMTASHLRERADGERTVWLVTPEDEPLELFGEAAAGAIQPMLSARGIRLRTSSRPLRVRGRALMMAGGAEVYVDRVIALPELEGPRLIGAPFDRHGFVPVDTYGRVRGLADVYGVGDATTFPLKQGGLAAQQADTVAETIASSLGLPITPRPFHPVLRGLLLTGGAPLYLRAEAQRLPRAATVAIEATRSRGATGSAGSAGSAGSTSGGRAARNLSSASGQALWWPPAKIAGRYLGPFMATARPQPLASELLTDRIPLPGPPVPAAEYEDALELALLMADADARWGDYAAALNALDAAEALQGALPPEYEGKRRAWLAAAQAA